MRLIKSVLERPVKGDLHIHYHAIGNGKRARDSWSVEQYDGGRNWPSIGNPYRTKEEAISVANTIIQTEAKEVADGN